MWPFKKPPKPLTDPATLEKALRDMQADARRGDLPAVLNRLEALQKAKVLRDPLALAVTRGLVDIFAQQGTAPALDFIAATLRLSDEHPKFYFMTLSIEEPEFHQALRSRALALIETERRAQALEPRKTAPKTRHRLDVAIADCCFAITNATVEIGDDMARAKEQWRLSLERLTRRYPKWAFAVAAKAARAPRMRLGDAPLKPDGLEAWERAVRHVAQKDRTRARTEAFAKASRQGLDAYYGDVEALVSAHALKTRAQQILKNL